MSQHEIESGNYSLFLGWDAPLQTFFFQLWDNSLLEEEEEEEPLAQIGTSLDEQRDVDRFIQTLKDKLNSYEITIPPELNDDLVRQLEEEQKIEGDGFSGAAPEIQSLVVRLSE
ncbi:MAG: hypothetical protein WA919_02335 [Coleofasciculaceae cyanobacterium]